MTERSGKQRNVTHTPQRTKGGQDESKETMAERNILCGKFTYTQGRTPGRLGIYNKARTSNKLVALLDA